MDQRTREAAAANAKMREVGPRRSIVNASIPFAATNANAKVAGSTRLNIGRICTSSVLLDTRDDFERVRHQQGNHPQDRQGAAVWLFQQPRGAEQCGHPEIQIGVEIRIAEFHPDPVRNDKVEIEDRVRYAGTILWIEALQC